MMPGMWAASAFFSTALVMLPFSLLTVGFDVSAVDTAGVFGLVYAAVIGTFLGLMLSFYNIRRFGATPGRDDDLCHPDCGGPWRRAGLGRRNHRHDAARHGGYPLAASPCCKNIKSRRFCCAAIPNRGSY